MANLFYFKENVNQESEEEFQGNKLLTIQQKVNTLQPIIQQTKQNLSKSSLKQKLSKFPKFQLKPQQSISIQTKSNQTNEQKQKIKSFSQLNIIKPILKAIFQKGYVNPMLIQQMAIPAILSGKDVFGESITGSGKTAAFLIPIIQKLYFKQRQNYIKCLIITPSRQLAIQIYQQFISLNKYTRLFCALIIGGSSIAKQQVQLRKFPQIVIGTTGRIIDHLINSKNVSFDDVQVLVLDQADKLLQMGFEDELKQIQTFLGQNIQTIMFSATLGDKIKALAKTSLKKPIKISANPQNVLFDYQSTAQKLHQQIVLLKNQENREAVLLSIISKIPYQKIIIFFKTKKQAHRFAIILGLLNIDLTQIHGNMCQQQRVKSYYGFKNDQFKYLLATDLAARGLDLKEVKCVINFQMPNQLTKYIHRVGRTARIGQQGISITLCNQKQKLTMKKLLKKTNDKIFKLNIDETIIRENRELLKQLEKNITEIIKEEKLERQIRLAEMEIKKAQNIENHKQQIFNQPKKLWFMSKKKKSKKNIKKESNQQKIENKIGKKQKKIRKIKIDKKKMKKFSKK